MCAQHTPDQPSRRPNLLLSIFSNKCSRCRRGRLYVNHNPYNFRHMMQMNEKCHVCGQPFEIEVGFWYGTGFVSYALSVAVCVASFIAWKVLIGMSLSDNRIFWWIGLNAVLLIAIQPILMRLSRTIWLNFFVWYDPNWAEKEAVALERTNPNAKNDW